MSRYRNVETGQTYMTKQNAIRHYLSKARKAKKRNNFDEMWKIYCDFSKLYDTDFCYKCEMDDTGYCYFRGKNAISQEERFKKYCFDGFIRSLERQMIDLQA
jgi:hypothetical protein